jgi:hypothetical protein
LVRKYAELHEATAEAVLLAWLLKHPAKIQPVLGTSRPDRLRACEGGFDFFKPRRMVLSLCRSPGRAYALKFAVTLPGRVEALLMRSSCFTDPRSRASSEFRLTASRMSVLSHREPRSS